MHVLITGGAGFIGSHLCDALINHGHTVRILDNLEQQVHGGSAPTYLNRQAEFIEGDVRDAGAVEHALRDIDAVVHCAAAVGVGQSQYEIKRYCDVNIGGTANLLDCIVNKKLPVKKIVMPTSMTAYGEGMYRCEEHGHIRPGPRREEQLTQHDWHVRCPICKAATTPSPTPETAERQSGTVYALTKDMQEQLVLNVCRTYGIAATALRLFNVYGPRQSLRNPYTGVTAIFLARLLSDQPPVIYEDGLQSRDFVSVHDVVRAFESSLIPGNADGQVLNIGSGKSTTILDVAQTLAALLGKDIAPLLPGEYRANDTRSCTADITKAKHLLHWSPILPLKKGLQELIAWSREQPAEDHFTTAAEALRSRGLQR